MTMDPSLGAVCVVPFEHPFCGKAGRANPEAAQVGKLRGGDMTLSLTTVALRMWCVLQGVVSPGTQSGLAEV